MFKTKFVSTSSNGLGTLTAEESGSFKDVKSMKVSPLANEFPFFFLAIVSDDAFHSDTHNVDKGTQTTSWVKKKQVTTVEPDQIYDSSSNGAQLVYYFLDEDTANRVAKAMVHAVELCGGGSKPEPF